MNSSLASERGNHESIHTSDFLYEQQQHSFPQKLRFASIMAILAGITDALCLQRFHCFVTMMTGNTIVMSISLSEKKMEACIVACITHYEISSWCGVCPIIRIDKSKVDCTHCKGYIFHRRLFTHVPSRTMAESRRTNSCTRIYGMIYGYAYQE
jgi:hypothetical protein